MAQRVALDLSFKSPIRQLTETNYSEWLIDVRALLRKQKLWKYTQETPPGTLTVTALAKWKDSSKEAADAMTPTISGPVKQRLAADEFNCGFKMMSHLADLYRPTGDNEFMRLTAQYYTIKYNKFDSVTDYITHIKLLEERIAATNVKLTPDKQTILCLSMSLPDHLQYLTKIWAVTPDMTAHKAVNILLEEERKGEKPKLTEAEEIASIFTNAGVISGSDNRKSYKTCGKMHRPVCYTEHPELAPEWYHEMTRGTKRKRTENEATAAIAFSF
ncbi:hypothetical protein HO173_002880 [Letharia columbiana]|uniref:DUF4219 domain-containing protein n=1 Tax=Letharia columbiana TaxID=112416 RepID=A0A8H6G2A8_9LECA|nr:uncharacterized protein HO173_002880 [Letharia columbiana]KAF6239008.1 hypothetical protein HO173_002880 [Letharia columbiana]